MSNATLVTTALEETWSDSGSLIFLGSWCRSFGRQETWSSREYETVPYHWDDRSKLAKDYEKLAVIYEHYLHLVADKLNDIHQTTFSLRFWRILIGPWLYTFIQVLFDRWYMLHTALSKTNRPDCRIIDRHFSSLIATDVSAFNAAIETDDWNEGLYGLIIKNFFFDKTTIHLLKPPPDRGANVSKPISDRLRSIVTQLCNLMSKVFARDSDILLIGTHMSVPTQILLNLKLRQFPAIWFQTTEKYEFESVSPHRDDLLFDNGPGVLRDFESVLDRFVLNLIPTIYLEGFSQLLDSSLAQGWPKAPKAIYTSNSYASDEKFKCWTGYQVDRGCKLIIGQHGGNFGMTSMATHETHQITISDRWLSWGWSDDSEPKVKPVGNFKSSFKPSKRRRNGGGLLVSMTLPRYSYYLYSVPIAGQMELYWRDQQDFLLALPGNIRRQLRIRLYPADRGWFQEKRWRSYTEEIAFDDAKIPLVKSLKNSRVFIGTYNATTYLETFSANIPSVLFWNPSHWEVTEEADIYFQHLRRVGILHNNPRSAAEHLTNIWDRIDDWWFSFEVQAAVEKFNDRYSRKNPELLETLTRQISF